MTYLAGIHLSHTQSIEALAAASTVGLSSEQGESSDKFYIKYDLLNTYTPIEEMGRSTSKSLLLFFFFSNLKGRGMWSTKFGVSKILWSSPVHIH